MKRYRVKLSAEERRELNTLVSRGRVAAYKQTHGRVLLLSDEAHADGAMKDEDITRVLQIGRARWNGCAAVAWRKGSKQPWGVRSNNAAGQRNWMVLRKPA